MGWKTRAETIKLYRQAARGDQSAKRELHRRQKHLSDAAIDATIQAVKRGPERSDRIPVALVQQ